MKIFIVQNVARQVEGDLMLVQVEKVFTTKEEATRYLAGLPRQKVESITTEAGPIDCFCARGIYEADVEGTTSPEVVVKEEPPKKEAVGRNPFTPEEIARLQTLLARP